MKKLLLAFAACAAAFCGTVAFADGGSDVTTHPSGDWVVTKLTGNGDDCVITDGTLKYAYAPTARTVNGVTFVANSKLVNATDDIEAVPAFGYDKGDHNNNDPAAGALPSGGWRDLLGSGWLNNGSKPADSTFTFKDLTKGNIYKVQLLVHNGNNIETPARSIFSPDGQEGFYGKGKDGSHADWALGCSLVGTFVATNTEHQLTFSYSRQAVGWKNLNAIQLRDLGAYVPMSINARAANMIPGDWIVCPMAGEPGDIVTRGDKVEALAAVEISGDDSTVGLSFKVDYYGSNISFDLWSHYISDQLGDCGFAGTGYGKLLSNGYCGQNQARDRVINLRGLEPGKLYLLQGFVHDVNHPERQMAVASKTIAYSAAVSSDRWYYGGTFVHVFLANSGMQTIDLDCPLYGALLNGVQLRRLPDVTMPSIALAEAEAGESSGTVTLSGIEIGMGWDAAAASKYDVWARLNNGEMKKVIEGSDAKSVTFGFEELDPGEYDVTAFIVNDKGVQSANVTASFTIGAVEPQTYVVTDVSDNFANPIEGSLRWALSKVRTGDTVTFAPELAGQTIFLVPVPSAGADSSLVIRKAITIEGPEGGITIDGQGQSKKDSNAGTRIFLVEQGIEGTVVFRNLELTHGMAQYWSSYGNTSICGGGVCAYSPVWIDKCHIHDCYSSTQHPSGGVAWGPALYTEVDALVTDTVIEDNSHDNGNNSYGGAVLAKSGKLTMKNVIARHNITTSWGGGFLFAAAKATLNLEDCLIENCAAHNGGGAIRIVNTESDAGLNVERVFKRCFFRGCYCWADQGGAILCDGASGRCIFDCCEFDDCNGGWGGAARLNGPHGIFLNCSFRKCNSHQWGPAVDIRNGAQIVNCTFVGCFDTCSSGDANSTSAALFCCGGTVNILNSVGAFNYYKACTDPQVDDDAHQYSGTRNFYNSVMNAAVWGDGNKKIRDFNCFTERIFTGEMETVSSVGIYGAQVALARDCDVPTWNPDPKAKYASKVIGIVRGGLLDGAGYKVAVNDGYTYIEYSPDGGTTWKELYDKDSNLTHETAEAKLIVADQRGVAYYKGKTPIGAATIEPSAGMYLIIR